jgi:tetratricopeptide (TPR) repeat protein
MWLVISGVAVALIWLVALVVCGIRRSWLKPWHWEAALAIGIPFLVGGILLTSLVHSWRTTRNVLILVEPFSGIGEQDGDIGELIKIGIEKAIPSEDERRVKVMLANRRESDSTNSAELQKIAKRHLADMIISGSYIHDGGKVYVCTNFRVVHIPKELPAVFRGRESFPQIRVFSKQEIENANVYFVCKPLKCECILMLGAGAYASGNWEMAEKYFRKALDSIEGRELEIRNGQALDLKSDPNSETTEQQLKRLKADKALAQLYCGHALINQDKLAQAIGHYDKAIKHCKEASAGNVRCQEILARAYVSRGIAYRQRNAFEAAAADFQEVEGYSRLADYPGKREEYDLRTYSAEDEVELYKFAKEWYKHGDKYLTDGTLVHAQTEFEMSAEVFGKLRRTSHLAASRRLYDFKFARSLVRLGEVHHRQAGSENPEYAARAAEAIKQLEEANKILKDRGDDKSKRLRAECLRHLGIAHFAKQERDEYKTAEDYHKQAQELWKNLKIYHKVAGELVRIGDVHRRRATLGDKDLNEFDNAIEMYKDAVKELGARAFLASPDSDAQTKSDPNKQTDVLVQAVAAKNAHHLANALTHLAEAYIEKNRYFGQTNGETDSADLSKAIGLLDCAVKCYCSVRKEIEKEQKNKTNKEKEKEGEGNEDKGDKNEKEEKQKTWSELLAEERNPDLRDDLAWCLTIRGYGLLMQAKHLREQGLSKKKEATLKEAETILQKAEKVLQEAEALHRELPGEDEDKDNLAWNLFALAAAQYGLVEKDSEKLKAGERSLLEACKMLRKMTRKKKKIWFSDYLEDSFTVLAESKHVQEIKKEEAKKEEAKKEEAKKEEREKRDDIDKLGYWWRSSVVREGKEALDNIINALEEKTAKSQ